MHSQTGGISAMRLSRELVVSYESAWSVAKRIRRAMAGEEAEFCRRIAGADIAVSEHPDVRSSSEPPVASFAMQAKQGS
jgi:hypothetical protein